MTLGVLDLLLCGNEITTTVVKMRSFDFVKTWDLLNLGVSNKFCERGEKGKCFVFKNRPSTNTLFTISSNSIATEAYFKVDICRNKLHFSDFVNVKWKT